MTIIADSSFIYALYNPTDKFHRQAMLFAAINNEDVLVPNVVLPEVSYLFSRDSGYEGVKRFIGYFRQINAEFVALTKPDLARVHEITLTYSDAAFDIVDCCIMAIAERLDVTRIATFDRRDFSIFRPKHCDFFELLP